MTLLLSAPTAVERGAEFLDTVMPGWHELVDVDRLDESSALDCVLAQVTGLSWAQMADQSGDVDAFCEWSDDLGFSTLDAEATEMASLAWRVEIDRRS